MADLGSIADSGQLTKGTEDVGPRWDYNGADSGHLTKSADEVGPRWALRSVECANQYLALGGREETEVLVAPSLRLDARGTWRFKWVVTAGARTLTVGVKQAVNLSPRPQLVIKANTDIGVNADVTTVAASSTGWVTVSAAVAPTSAGVLEGELQARYDGMAYAAACYWDTVTWT